jgi:heme a synthase
VPEVWRRRASRLGPVSVETARLARLRSVGITARLFRRLAVGAVLALWLVVATGALVRLTASGLGCESWPGCGARSFFPEESYHGYVEFGNRVVSTIPIALTLAVGILAWFAPGLPQWARIVASAVLVGTLAQAPLGLLTIATDLHPLMVMSHFLLALLALAGAVVVAIEARGAEVGRAAPTVPPLARIAALVVVGLGLALVVTGAFVTAAGPHPGDRARIERLGTISDSIWVHVRVTAAFGLALLGLLLYLWRGRERWPRVMRAGGVVLLLVVVQMAIGEYQWRNALPWEVVLAHVVLAAAVWGAIVAFAALIWRPPRAKQGAGHPA